VQRYVPEFEKRWSRYARPVGDSWLVDEAYLKIKGQWVYLYRTVDKAGSTVDFLLSRRRDIAAAKRFFSRATRQHAWTATPPRIGRSAIASTAADHRCGCCSRATGLIPSSPLSPGAKASILAKAVEGPITGMISASAIQLHPNCKVVIEEDAARELKERDYYDWIFQNEPERQEFRARLRHESSP
jgi:DDE domain